MGSVQSQVRREVVDSISRVYLRRGDGMEGLVWAQELIQAPHETDASSWQLLAQCHMMLNNTQGNDSFLSHDVITLNTSARSVYM